MLYLLDQIRSWLASIFIASLAVATVTLVLHRLLRRKPASVRLGVGICGLSAILVLGLMPALPFQTGLLKEQPKWLPAPAPANVDIPSTIMQVPTGPEPPESQTAAPLPVDWLMLAYVSGVALLLFRLAAGLGMAVWLKSRSTKLEGSLPIRLSSKVSMPLALGGFRPCVLLPLDARTWPEERVREVYLHEAAHLKNLDWVWQTLANVVSIFHWFNPAVWLVNRNLRADMERLADDAVLIQGIAPSSYASTLVELAKTRQAGATGVLGIPFGRPQGLKGRVSAILNPGQPRSLLSKARLAGVLLATSLVFGTLSALALGQSKGPGIMADVRVKNAPTQATPATPSNGYKAKLRDGRTLEVLQVTQFSPGGKTESWLPDGNPIPTGKEVKIPPVKERPWVKAMLIRYPMTPRAGAFGLYLNALPEGEKYRYLNYSGGKLLPAKDGYRYGICYFGLPKPVAEASFSLGIEDAEQQVGFVWKQDGTTSTLIPGVSNFKIEEIDSSTLDGEKQYWVKDYKGPATKITWTDGYGPDWMVINNFQMEKLSREDIRNTYSANLGGERVTYFMQPKSALKSFSLVLVPRFSCEVRQVKMKPSR